MNNEIDHEKECQGRCPKCNSDNIDYGASEPSGELLIYNAGCNDCGLLFTEEYTVKYSISVYQERV